MSEEEPFEELLESGESSLDHLQTVLEDVDAPEELGDDELEEVLGDVDALVRVAQETAELVEALDLSELPEAVDGEELLEAIETGEIPDAVAEEETGASDVVDLTQLFSALDLLSVWDAADLTDIWEQKRELDEATDALGDGEDEGTLEGAAETVVDEGTDLVGGDDGDGLLDEVDPKEAAMEAFGTPDVEEDPEAYQVFIQQQAMRGIDAFRDALLETHETFQKLYETNREKMRREDTSPSSRNPTAASTIATERRDIGTSNTRHSTVPQQVKLSTAPTRRRIYGRRFELELERKRRQQNDD
ncbi:hypothetical protein [Natronococcus jeotgali]|uniref:Uncharacterized protein n=1 Tax=Natronococcus jeotgali DSM 18795 TaxID=1227498 RepID=L9X6A2_9EURY|nr:hypothetical protein [Natronococcus jeotgali]ELY56971.1 hypothetical protein C492_14210 [Natronococcus jeotgali DSM 18795]